MPDLHYKNIWRGWQTTISGVVILVFVAWLIHTAPGLAEQPTQVLTLAVGLAALFMPNYGKADKK
jgi:hypothetical protein